MEPTETPGLFQSLFQRALDYHCIVMIAVWGGSSLNNYSRTTSISRFLATPLPPCKILTKHGRSCGKVLTSLENREAIQKRAEAKEKELREKEERKAMREANALAKKVAKGRAIYTNKNGIPCCMYMFGDLQERLSSLPAKRQNFITRGTKTVMIKGRALYTRLNMM